MITREKVLAHENLEEYCAFVYQRHLRWLTRQGLTRIPVEPNELLDNYRFTNVFRCLDTYSQHLISLLHLPDILNSPRATFMLCALHGFNYTMDVQTRFTELGEDALGPFLAHHAKPFGGAYMVPPTANYHGKQAPNKAEGIWHAIINMADQLTPSITSLTLKARYNALRVFTGVGDFLAMQIATNLGYSPQSGAFQENTFVVPGVGAVKGARYLGASGASDAWELIPILQEIALERGLAYIPLRTSANVPKYHDLSLMDIQNTLCEFSKFMSGTAKRRKYVAQPLPPFPQEWALPNHWH